MIKDSCECQYYYYSQVIAQSTIQHGFGLTLYGDWLFWTDWVLRAVVRVNKYSGDDVTYMTKNIPRQPMGIIAVFNDTEACKLYSHVF